MMFTKTKLALAAVLIAGSASTALAQDGWYGSHQFDGWYAPQSNGRYTTRDSALSAAPYAPQYNRRIPGNQGDTSYGQDWAAAYGGGF